MIRFKSITLRNFLSYGNNTTVVHLDRPGTTLIVGEDLDNTTNGQGANGVGKSTLINALSYAIYDKPISNISKDNLVNNINKKNMEVVVEFTANDGKNYMIRRTRKSKAGAAGNAVHLYEEGKDITPDSAANTNEKIEHIIGIPYELFVRIVVFSASHVPFLDLPVKSTNSSNQTDIIEELFSLTVLSAKAAALKETIRETETALQMKQVKIELLEKEHVRHQQQLDSAVARVEQWNATNAALIEQLQSKLKKVDKVDIEQQKTLHESATKLSTAIDKLNVDRKQVNRELSNIFKALNKLEQDLNHLQKDKCPYCLQQYAGAHEKIETAEQEIDVMSQDVDKLEAELVTIDEEIKSLTQKLATIRNEITVDNLNELLEISSESETIKRKIQDLQTVTNPYLEPLEELSKVELEKIEYTEVNELTKRLEHQKFLQKILTKKDSFVRKALLNKNIPYLNSRLAHYLTTLGLTHRVVFTHEMTAEISQFDRTLDFGNLSAGQRARVNLALSFAFRDVLLNLHTKINICMLDEVLDVGLDAVGVQAAARLLKRKARDEQLSLYIISHRDEIDGAFDNTMTIQMIKGFSYIKEVDQ